MTDTPQQPPIADADAPPVKDYTPVEEAPKPAPVAGPSLIQVEVAGQTAYGFVVDQRDVDDRDGEDVWTQATVATLGGDLALVDAADVRPVTTTQD